MTKKILVLPGDGIGQEIVGEAVKLIKVLQKDYGLDVEMEEALVGGTAYDATGKPLPDETLNLAREADAVLLGAVGGYKWEELDIAVRPEKGLLGLPKIFFTLPKSCLKLSNTSSLLSTGKPRTGSVQEKLNADKRTCRSRSFSAVRK